MNTLRDSLTHLLTPVPADRSASAMENVWIVEITPDTAVDERGRPRVRRAEFRTPDEYEARFEELLAAGFAWINLSWYGLDGDRLIVGVEVPRQRADRPPPRTSINYSGPSRGVHESGGDVSAALAID